MADTGDEDKRTSSSELNGTCEYKDSFRVIVGGLLELGWLCALKKGLDDMLYNTGVCFVCSLRALNIDTQLIGFVWELVLHLRLLIRTLFCFEDYLLRLPWFKHWNKANRRFTERA